MKTNESKQAVLVECSDPGMAVSLDEELESVLRHISFDVARELKGKLGKLAAEMGNEVADAWSPMRIETPNQCGCSPLTFSTRAEVDRTPLERLTARAVEMGLGTFSVGMTNLMNQGGPNPETREQYIEDLAACIDFNEADDLSVISYPASLPTAMAQARREIVDEGPGEVLRHAALSSRSGDRWVQDTIERLRPALLDASHRSEAVMAYELGRLNPVEQEPRELRDWAAVAMRLGRHVEPWCTAFLASRRYGYQRTAALTMLYRECGGRGPARPFLDAKREENLAETKAAYTEEGATAVARVLARVFDD